MKVTILEPKGYCAGVNNAISLALKIKDKYPRQIVTVLGMLVHNSYVTSFLKEKGIDMVDNINDISRGVVIFTAHGHRQEWEDIAKEKGLIIYDAICPLVKKNILSIVNESDHHQII
ncbi:MAG: 4-hydroxy-3-methylbut-2-enyl diphosphate reductase, partial [Bacilli bacterium]